MGGRCCKFELSASATTDTIQASADVVWDIITQLESWPEFISMVKEVKRIHHNPNCFYSDDEIKKKNDCNNKNKKRRAILLRRNVSSNTCNTFQNDYSSNNDNIYLIDNSNNNEITTSKEIDNNNNNSEAISISSELDFNERWREGTTWNEIRMFKGQEFLCRKSITDLTKYKVKETPSPSSSSNNTGNNKKKSQFVRSVGIHISHRPFFLYNSKNSTNTTSFTVVPIDNRTCKLVASMGFVSEGILQCVNPERLFLQRRCKRYMTQWLQEEINDFALAASTVEASSRRFSITTTPPPSSLPPPLSRPVVVLPTTVLKHRCK